MPLIPPPNPQKTYQITVLALGLVLLAFVLISDHSPKVGDHLHNLPFGGEYKDGTKTIKYFQRPNQHSLSKTLAKSHNTTIFLIILGLIGTLHGLHYFSNSRRVSSSLHCVLCKNKH